MAADELGKLRNLLMISGLPPLGPGPREGVRSALELTNSVQTLFAGSKTSARNRELIRALVLLWDDHLDPAHVIVQEIQSGDGAFIHGIVHRREPDFSNAKYWFHRVAKHPAYPLIADRADNLLKGTPFGKGIIRDGQFDPIGFVDACQRSGEAEPLQELQKIETEVLLQILCDSPT